MPVCACVCLCVCAVCPHVWTAPYVCNACRSMLRRSVTMTKSDIKKKTSRNVKLLKASMDLYRLALLFRGLAFVSVWWCCFSYGSVRSAVLPFCRV